MKYHIGDKFLINGIEAVVRFTNQGKAWLAPVSDEEINKVKILAGCVFATLDEKGRLPSGERPLTIINSNCGAV